MSHSTSKKLSEAKPQKTKAKTRKKGSAYKRIDSKEIDSTSKLQAEVTLRSKQRVKLLIDLVSISTIDSIDIDLRRACLLHVANIIDDINKSAISNDAPKIHNFTNSQRDALKGSIDSVIDSTAATSLKGVLSKRFAPIAKTYNLN